MPRMGFRLTMQRSGRARGAPGKVTPPGQGGGPAAPPPPVTPPPAPPKRYVAAGYVRDGYVQWR